jgi:hypothetical protein
MQTNQKSEMLVAHGTMDKIGRETISMVGADVCVRETNDDMVW